MSEDDTIPPETDDEIRVRLRAYAGEVTERVDTEAALQRMPRRSRPPTIRLLAIAACLIAVVALAAVVGANRRSVDTVPPSESPTTESTTPSETAEDDPTTLAYGQDIELVGGASSGLGAQTLNIDAVEQDGEVTGEFQVGAVVTRVECANTDTDGIVIVGGEVTTGAPGFVEVGDLQALIIREGDPDSVALIPNEGTGAKSCDELLDSIPEDPVTGHESDLVEVGDGHDISTARTIRVNGEDVELGDGSGLGNQTLNVHALEQGGETTGEFRINDNVIRVECAENILEGRVVLAGTATAGGDVEVGDLYALIIREGDPDSVALVPNDHAVGSPPGWGGYYAGSCEGFLETIPKGAPPAGLFLEVEDGHDIETG